MIWAGMLDDGTLWQSTGTGTIYRTHNDAVDFSMQQWADNVVERFKESQL